LKKLVKKIEELTPEDKTTAIEVIRSMVTTEDDYITLSQESLHNALSIEGEYLVLQLKYEDFQDELKYENIKYKIAQSLSVVVSYEDDGHRFADIEQFVNYIKQFSDPKQNSIFGIKKVAQLSEYPITILFSGILPINQIKMHLSKDLYELIHSDKAYYKENFTHFRNLLSQQIGIPILPLFPILDESLSTNEVRLIDLTNERVLSKLSSKTVATKESIHEYLQKLFTIYLTLAKQREIKAKV